VDFVRTPEGRFAELPGYPFAPHYITLDNGLRMHYVDEGPANAEPVLLLHGQLAAAPQRLARVVATNTVLHTADAALAGALTWACHGTADGDVVVAPELLDYQRLTQELPSFEPSLFIQGATASEVEPSVLRAYDAPFPDETFCAGARQLPLLMGLTPGSECARRNRRTMEFLESFTGPFLTAFSDGDPSTEGWDRLLQRTVPGAAGQPHAVIAGAGHFVQEDRGLELAGIIARFVRENPR
jgi:haloalkane dehalogenase